LEMSLLCGTFSNAFAKSIIIKSVWMLLSLFDILTINYKKSVETRQVPLDWNHTNVTPVKGRQTPPSKLQANISQRCCLDLQLFGGWCCWWDSVCLFWKLRCFSWLNVY
jgi:hypothetical protein